MNNFFKSAKFNTKYANETNDDFADEYEYDEEWNRVRKKKKKQDENLAYNLTTKKYQTPAIQSTKAKGKNEMYTPAISNLQNNFNSPLWQWQQVLNFNQAINPWASSAGWWSASYKKDDKRLSLKDPNQTNPNQDNYYTPVSTKGKQNVYYITNQKPKQNQNTETSSAWWWGMSEQDRLALENLLSYNKPAWSVENQNNVAKQRAENNQKINLLNSAWDTAKAAWNIMKATWNAILKWSEKTWKFLDDNSKAFAFNPFSAVKNFSKWYANNMRSAANLAGDAFNKITWSDLKHVDTWEEKTLIERSSDTIKKWKEYRKEAEESKIKGEQWKI